MGNIGWGTVAARTKLESDPDHACKASILLKNSAILGVMAAHPTASGRLRQRRQRPGFSPARLLPSRGKSTRFCIFSGSGFLARARLVLLDRRGSVFTDATKHATD
jgi:hypothetical protein